MSLTALEPFFKDNSPLQSRFRVVMALMTGVHPANAQVTNLGIASAGQSALQITFCKQPPTSRHPIG
jgi:hypothetical protein